MLPEPEQKDKVQPDLEGSQQPGEDEPSEEESLIPKEEMDWLTERLQNGDPLTTEERTKAIKHLGGFNRIVKKNKDEHSRRLKVISEREQEIVKVAEDLKSAQQAKTSDQVKAEGKKVLDDLLDSTTDPQARETLRNLRDIIREETNVGELRKSVDEIKQAFQLQVTSTQQARYDTLEKEVDALVDRYSDSLVEKHRDQILDLGLKYTQYSARRLLHSVADPDELDQALRIQGKRDGSESTGRRKATEAVTSTTGRPAHEEFQARKPDEIQTKFRSAIDKAVRSASKKLV